LNDDSHLSGRQPWEELNNHHKTFLARLFHRQRESQPDYFLQSGAMRVNAESTSIRADGCLCPILASGVNLDRGARTMGDTAVEQWSEIKQKQTIGYEFTARL
jgi:hypothetical protein